MAGLAILVIKLLVISSLKLNRFISDNTLQCTSVVAIKAKAKNLLKLKELVSTFLPFRPRVSLLRPIFTL